MYKKQRKMLINFIEQFNGIKLIRKLFWEIDLRPLKKYFSVISNIYKDALTTISPTNSVENKNFTVKVSYKVSYKKHVIFSLI